MLKRIQREPSAVEWRRFDAGEWVTEGGCESKVASDGSFPLQKESMAVLVMRQFF